MTEPLRTAEPLRIRFVVGCARERAFRLWTEALGRWWPADHTVSGNPAAVSLEGRVGGRIYERARDGSEHDWGRVTRFEPPARLGYSWHLGRPPSAATDVEVVFSAGEDGTTIIEIEHRGWERLGPEAGLWRERNRAGWSSVLPHLSEAADAPDPPDPAGRPRAVEDDGHGRQPTSPTTEGGRR